VEFKEFKPTEIEDLLKEEGLLQAKTEEEK
jgi:hypothetical protein